MKTLKILAMLVPIVVPCVAVVSWASGKGAKLDATVDQVQRLEKVVDRLERAVERIEAEK